MTTSATSIDHLWMKQAIELSRRCPPSATAYSVGAVVIDANGNELAHGYSRESGPKDHAEESALAKLAVDDPRLSGATIYSTLEPCSQRRSRSKSCSQLIVEAGIKRVVIAWREPSLFVDDCVGVERLTAAGATVIEIPELASAAMAVNSHLPFTVDDEFLNSGRLED